MGRGFDLPRAPKPTSLDTDMHEGLERPLVNSKLPRYSIQMNLDGDGSADSGLMPQHQLYKLVSW